MSGKPVWKTFIDKDPLIGKRNITQVYFEFEKYQVDGGVANAEIEQIVLDHMNEAIKDANYQIDQTPFIVMEEFSYMLDPREHVMRLTKDLSRFMRFFFFYLNNISHSIN